MRVLASLLLAATFLPALLPAQVRLDRIASGVTNCTDIQSPRDGSGRLFFVRRDGVILLWRNGSLQSQPFLDIRSRVLAGGERGLLGLAFPPAYAQKRYFYVNYTDRSGATVIARYFLTNPDLADSANEQVLLTIAQPFANHNGGQIQFGPDGMLYIGMGDGGGANDPVRAGQDPNTLLGKMLRIDTESNLARYAIPPDNPFVSTPSHRPEIWALGLRNPWRFSFDATTGDLYIADVGQNRFEEVNFQPRSSSGGENYGWVTMEGNECVQAGCNTAGLARPIWTYPRSEGLSITGGYVWRGAYYYGDYVTGRIWALRRTATGWQNSLVTDLGRSFAISTFGLGEDGSLYVANFSSGEIFRLVESGLTNAASFAPGLTPGALTTLFSENLINQDATFLAPAIPLPTSLGGFQLRINGVLVPLLAVLRNQVNFQAPWNLSPGSTARLEFGSSRLDIPVLPLQPGLFGVIIRGRDFALETGPLVRGESYILYATGLGPFTQAVETGAALPGASPLQANVALRLGEVPCPLDYAGAAPGFVGLVQLNFRVPSDAPLGPQSLTVTANSAVSPALSVSVTAN